MNYFFVVVFVVYLYSRVRDVARILKDLRHPNELLFGLFVATRVVYLPKGQGCC